MGFLYSNRLTIKEKLFKSIYVLIKKIVFLKKNKILIIENSDDINFLKKYNLKHQIVFIKGSGVDLKNLNLVNLRKKN